MRSLQPVWFTFTLMTLLFCVVALDVQAQPQEIPLGSTMPLADRALPNASDGRMTLAQAAGERGTVVIFWSNQCPWVDKYERRIFALVEAFQGRGVGFVLVNANDPTAFPEESQAQSARENYGVPYLMDEGSQLARALGASRTPHVFVFNDAGTLVYAGGIDDSPADADNVENRYLQDVLQSLVEDTPVDVAKTKAFGCTIKVQEPGG